VVKFKALKLALPPPAPPEPLPKVDTFSTSKLYSFTENGFLTVPSEEQFVWI